MSKRFAFHKISLMLIHILSTDPIKFNASLFFSGVMKLSIHHSHSWPAVSRYQLQTQNAFFSKNRTLHQFPLSLRIISCCCLHQKSTQWLMYEIEHNQKSVQFKKLMNTRRGGIVKANYCFYKRKNCKKFATWRFLWS